jgi:predicted AlkP superfamily phosphohydrolase/phosphomutase
VVYTYSAVDAPKLTVIGLDAATFTVIEPMIEAGELPNLARCFAAGTHGVLRSTTHPVTTQAWTTMLTGVNAGQHGMWEFCERDASGYRLRLVNGSYRQAPTVWERLTAAGRRVGIVNVPFTWPAQEVRGFFIAGLDAAAREAGMTYPRELLSDLRRRYGKLEFDHALPLDEQGYIDIEQMRRALRQKVDYARWLTERFHPDLLVVVFMIADHMQHFGWAEWEEKFLSSRVAEIYRMLDEAVGGLARHLDSGDTMIVSDHGAGRLKGVVNLNAWLAEHGWLTYARSARRLRAGELSRQLLYRLLERRRKLPKRLRNFAKQRAPALRERVYQLREFTAIDFPRTQAFAYGNFGNVVINVRGRERYGVVDPGEEYDELCKRIAEEALRLVDPSTGERLVAAVHRRDALFHGPALVKIPDLIFEFTDYAWAGKGNLMRPTPTIWDTIKMAESGRETYVGTHRAEGIIALAGPSFRREGRVSAAIEDVTPTILYLLGEPIPIDLDGRLLEEALDPALLEGRPPEYAEAGAVGAQQTQGYGADEVAEVEGRLRSLGYLE